MLATLTISGSAAASTQTACGRRARTMRSETIRCSRRSLSLRSSCSPRWSSTAGSELRRVEPARATVETLAPERRTSSSGLAPMKAASGVPTQKQKQAGNCSRMAPNRAAGSWAAPALTTTSRASTTLLISPASIRAVAAADGGFEVARRAGAADLRVRGRVRVEHRQRRLAAQAGQARRHRGAARVRVVSRLDDRVEREEGAIAAAAERELGQDQRAGRERGPGRGAAALGVEGEAAEPDRAGTRRQPARLVEDRRRRLFAGTARRRRRKRAAPREAASWATPSPARAKPRSGCSQQNQRSEARREAKTAAQGSAMSVSTVTLTSVRRPRRTALPTSSVEELSRYHGRSRSPPCEPFRPGRAGGPCARRPRSCRRSRSPRSSSCDGRRRRSWPGRSPRTG